MSRYLVEIRPKREMAACSSQPRPRILDSERQGRTHNIRYVKFLREKDCFQSNFFGLVEGHFRKRAFELPIYQTVITMQFLGLFRPAEH